MMNSSTRNAPVDQASSRIVQYLRIHNYDDCAIYINRLNSNTFRKILNSDFSVDTLLSQLPFSIEIFEVVYSKIFILDPDTFPLRLLKPERLLSKMISLFALCNVEKSSSSSSTSPAQESTLNNERLLSNLASILRIISYVQPVLFKRLLRQNETIDQCILYFEQRHSSLTSSSTLPRSSSMTHINLEEAIRHELESTISCCQQALQKLGAKTISMLAPAIPSSTHSTPVLGKKHHTMHKSNSAVSAITNVTSNSLDDVQNRLFQHKAMLNLVEPYLSRTKLYAMINNLGYKVSMDKQILLAYAHIKTHEKQIPLGEPLLPLFKRFAFGYERIIQLWRRVTDSALIDECTDDIVIDDTTSKGVSGTGGICFERTRSHNELPLHKDDLAIIKEPLAPLQPLIIDGREQRNRFLPTTNGLLSPSSSSSSHQIATSSIPPTSVSPSFTPLGSTIVVSHLRENGQQPTSNSELSTPNKDQDEKERLKTDLIQLKNELQKSKETIARLQKSEEQMRERLAEQAQRQLEKGGKFEDLNQVARPTELIRSYNSLYSQARIDALDALDSIREMCEAEDLKSKLLFSVVVLAFRHAQNQARDIRNKIKQILQLTNDKNSIVLEDTIEKYLRTTIQKHDVAKITYEVENQLWTTLYDYPALKACHELLKYITSACRTAWGLVNQTPPYYIEFQTNKFDKLIHERFHTSDNESETIMEYIWPCLIDGRDRTCVAKGVVITDERYLSIAKKIPS